MPAQNLLDYIEGGATIDEFFEDYPSVTRDKTGLFLELAKQQLRRVCSSAFKNSFSGYVLHSSGYGLAAFRVAGTLAPSSRVGQGARPTWAAAVEIT